MFARRKLDTRRRLPVAALLAAAAVALAVVAGLIQPAGAALVEGAFGREVLIGPDNDNASNTFIQPVGVNAKQHLENTDLLLGRGLGDLLIGAKGSDLLQGAYGKDVLIGGIDGGVLPNSDLIDGGFGDDVNIWAPGDGSDAFVGGPGYDTHINAPIVLNGQTPALFNQLGRQLPHVSIDAKPQFSCTIERVPADQQLGFDFVTRFLVNGTVVVTVRLEKVEQAMCTSPNPGHVQVADLSQPNPTFVDRPLSDFSGTLLGAILQAPTS